MSTDASVPARRATVATVAFVVFLGGAAFAAPHAAVPPAPVKASPAVETGGPSFFEPFDRLDSRRWFVSDGWVNGDHQGCTWSRENLSISKGVLQLVLGKAKDRIRPYRCAELRTVGHLGYGTYEGRMRTAAGSGLNTAFFTYSNETRDEIDFEFLGRDPGGVQLNYYQAGRGGHESTPKLGNDASAGFHDYAFVWAPGSIRWYIDGKLVRAVSGPDIPTVPSSLVLSLWNGTANIAGWLGPFDASHTPVSADYDWVAFTRAGEKCNFPESITCHPL
ncbi:family 16 glycosylhydrolase [Sphingomonas bacterium]|uniref:family 16 glycosylhydrolase n=1 Tax=Sphingomonas bacterium TaxID=1895847 RepID=UPI001576C2C4|nr:family 16 glycosylhydrolase [Sphingomonas bacterium]